MPTVTIVSGEDLTFYRLVSQRVFEAVSAWSRAVERLGMDELYIDLTEAVDARLAQLEADGASTTPLVPRGFLYPLGRPAADEDAVPLTADTSCCGSVDAAFEMGCAARLAVCSQICHEIRTRLQDEVGLTTSAGISVSKLLSKLVASEHKPALQTILVPTASSLTSLLPPTLPISKIPGIGFSATRRWHEVAVRTVDDLLLATESSEAVEVAARFDDKDRHSMRQLCLGVCDQPVVRSSPPKSIGAEDSFWQSPLTTLWRVEVSAAALARQLLVKLRSDEAFFGCRQPSTLAVTIRHHQPDASSGAEHAKRQTRQEKLQLRLGRLPRAGADPCVLPVLSADDERLADELAGRAVALFRQLVPRTSFALDIFNVSVRFDAGASRGEPANSIGNCLRAAATAAAAEAAAVPSAVAGMVISAAAAPSAALTASREPAQAVLASEAAPGSLSGVHAAPPDTLTSRSADLARDGASSANGQTATAGGDAALPPSPASVSAKRAVSSFFTESRLSFIATWKQRWRPMMVELMQLAPSEAALLQELAMLRAPSGSADSPIGSNAYMHVDMDCFFVSVAVRDQPELAGKPVAVVSGGESTSEVCSANYEARAFGLKADMFLREARQRCPELRTLRTSPAHFQACNVPGALPGV